MRFLSTVLNVVRARASTMYSTLGVRTNRWLHPARHRRAKSQLQRAGRARSILVVCHGNVCRSPYLEAALRHLLPDVRVSSAGLLGAGRVVPDTGTQVAARRGFDLSAHRSRVLTKPMLREADLVIVMDSRQARFVAMLEYPVERILVAGDLDPVAGESRTIQDPWQQPLEVFEAAYARLDRCARVLAERLHVESPAA